jgi:integrase/recombinase XerD
MVLEDIFRRPEAINRFRKPPLGSEMDGFYQWLCDQGFSKDVMRRRVWQVSHFNRYLRRLGIKDYRDVERRHAERFIFKHLPTCRCRGHGPSRYTSASVRSYINYLSDRVPLASGLEKPPPFQELLDEYLEHLKRDRNLSSKTIKDHRRYLVPFLEDLGTDAVSHRLIRLSPEEVQAYFVKQAKEAKPSILNIIKGVLRTFFSFCFRHGYIHRDLAQAIPRIHRYKLSHVPRDISEQDAQKVLDSIDRTTLVGRRDFAIIQLLYTYGVRGSQVRALRLQDIQWCQNRIRFLSMKGGKEIVEPLLDEVGESLLDYLRHGRPQAAYSEVFLTAFAPIHPLKDPSILSAIIARYMHKAGVDGPIFGPHAFRHGFATRMLKHGQSIKTIADMLGHRNINTTFIYTKVDFEALKQLPLDWPEV